MITNRGNAVKFTVEIYGIAKDGSKSLLHRTDVSSMTPRGAHKKVQHLFDEWKRRGAKGARVLNGHEETVYRIDE
jgi:hypothetical protein